jgi:two-component system, OmpR family, sensor histidine kinase MtrB
MSERPRAIQPARLRRRLTLAFALTAGIAAAALAAGSFLLVRDARLSDSRDRALEQSRFNLVLASEVLPTEGPDALLEAYARRGRFETVLLADGTSFPSSLSLGEEQVPDDLRALVAEGELAYERTEVADTRYLVTGGQVPGDEEDEAYFFFSEEDLWNDLADLRTILLVGLGIVVIAAALAGALLARRTLAPVARASTAARSLAEGLLDTRLPVESSDEFGAWRRPSTRWRTRWRRRLRRSRRRRPASAASRPTSLTSSGPR